MLLRGSRCISIDGRCNSKATRARAIVRVVPASLAILRSSFTHLLLPAQNVYCSIVRRECSGDPDVLSLLEVPSVYVFWWPILLPI